MAFKFNGVTNTSKHFAAILKPGAMKPKVNRARSRKSHRRGEILIFMIIITSEPIISVKNNFAHETSVNTCTDLTYICEYMY